MNKHIALVFGTIFSLTILLVPFTGAFASSDTSVALPQFVFSLMFSSVSVGSTIDVTNYNASTDTSSSDSSVHLYNTTGSYSQINRQGINVAQNLLCLRYTINNPSSGFFDDLVIEPYINGSPAHLYGTYTLSDNNDSITYYMFFYIGADTVRIKDSQGQDITPWGIRFTRTHDISYTWSFSSSSTALYYYNYTLQSQTVDPGEAAELALDIINVLQLSQLSENLGMINTQLDTGNIASMMESMLNYLANIPDIISYIDQIETYDSNILNAINTFYDFYYNQFQYFYQSDYSVLRYDSNYNAINNNNNINTNDIYYRFPYNAADNHRLKMYMIKFSSFNMSSFDINDFDVYYSFSDSIENSTRFAGYQEATILFTSERSVSFYHYINLNIVLDTLVTDTSDNNNYIFFHIVSKKNYAFSDAIYFYKEYQYSFYDSILLYLRQLLNGGSSKIPSDIQTTTDDINLNATTVNNFQSNTQQSLDQNLNDVPVVDYQIQATTGTQYMKAYSEALFNASNGFRIWYMLPLILFVIGMLIRWGVKK